MDVKFLGYDKKSETDYLEMSWDKDTEDVNVLERELGLNLNITKKLMSE